MIGVASSDFSESFKGSQLQCYKFGPQGLQGLQQPPNASSAVETTERMHQAEASHLDAQVNEADEGASKWLDATFNCDEAVAFHQSLDHR